MLPSSASLLPPSLAGLPFGDATTRSNIAVLVVEGSMHLIVDRNATGIVPPATVSRNTGQCGTEDQVECVLLIAISEDTMLFALPKASMLFLRRN